MSAPRELWLVAQALLHLAAARDLLTAAKCPKALARVRLALSSAKGARRAVAMRPYRDARRAKRGRS